MKIFKSDQNDEPSQGGLHLASAYQRLGFPWKPGDPWSLPLCWMLDEMSRRIVDLEQKMEAAKSVPRENNT